MSFVRLFALEEGLLCFNFSENGRKQVCSIMVKLHKGEDFANQLSIELIFIRMIFIGNFYDCLSKIPALSVASPLLFPSQILNQLQNL